MAYSIMVLTVRTYEVRVDTPIIQSIARLAMGKVMPRPGDEITVQHRPSPSRSQDRPGAGQRAQLQERLKVLGILP
jgi:hypothetical protein